MFLNCWQKFKTEVSLHIVYIKNMYARKKYGLELIRIICPKWLSFLQRDLCFLNIFKEVLLGLIKRSVKKNYGYTRVRTMSIFTF